MSNDTFPKELAVLQDALVALDRRLSILESPEAPPALALQRVEALESKMTEELAAIREDLPTHQASLVVFSGDLDRALAAFIIATGAATMGLEVTMFFTFWGLSAIKARRSLEGKSLPERMMSLMLPGSSQDMHPSKMAFFGAGAAMLRQMMKDKEVASLEDLIALAQEMGVKLVACEMSMEVMGIRQDELIPDVALGGVATFLADATKAKVSLFI